MHEVIGTLLPLALAAAFSPLPIIATILMLLSPRAKASALMFLLGWVVGVGLVAALFTFASDYLPQSEPGDKNVVAGIIRIALGLILLVLALRKWLKQRRQTSAPDAPKWMSSLSSTPPARSLVLGLALGGVNPKNLVIGVAAGLTIGTASLPAEEQIASVVIYTLLASVTVIAPVVAFVIVGQRLTGTLTALKGWLERNTSIIVSIIFVIFGVLLVGNGIASL